MANEFLSWDSEITKDTPEFILLPEGDYNFVVQGLEKQIYSGNSTKIPAGCPVAELSIVIMSDQGNTSVKDRLFLSTNMEWKLSSFFRSLGLKNHGESVKMPWDKVIGAEGRAHVIQEKWISNKDGSEKVSNRIGSYLDNTTEAAEAPKKPSADDMPFEI